MNFTLLKAERRQRGWSQAKVAEALGVSTRTVMRWEQGVVVPHAYYREPLCNLFDKTPEELGFFLDVDKKDMIEDLQPAPLVASVQQCSSLPDPTISEVLESTNNVPQTVANSVHTLDKVPVAQRQLVRSLAERDQVHEQEAYLPEDFLIFSQSCQDCNMAPTRNISAFAFFKWLSWHSTPVASIVPLSVIAFLSVVLTVIQQPFARSGQVTSTAPAITTGGVSYEADAWKNTLVGNAKVFDCSVCSGGKRVGDIGRNGALLFNNVNEKRAGTYRLTIYCVYGGTSRRPLYINVNNEPKPPVVVSGTGNWNMLVTYSILIDLRAGNNTIKLYNPQHSAPDIDRIVVSTQSTYP